MHLKNSLRAGACALALFLAASGCGSSGPKMYKVTGKVTLDGQPVGEATVHFEPYNDDPANRTGNAPGEGRTGADGVYSLTTNTTNDGVAAGEYKVVITKIASGGGSAIEAPPPGTDVTKWYMEKTKRQSLDQKSQMASAPKKEEQALPADCSSPATTPWKVKVPTADGKFDIALKKGGGT